LVSDLQAPYYNARVIPPEKAQSEGLKLLLDPQYKGKIVWYDPRILGLGSSFLSLVARVLGEEALMKVIVDQETAFVPNMNAAAEAIVRGKAVIAFGGNAKEDLKSYRDAGLDLDVRMLGNTPTTAYRGTDGGALAVFNHAPHPNAARVFANWIMSRRVGAGLSQAQHYSSRRSDVPPVDPDFAAIPGASYIYAQRGDNDTLMHKLMIEVQQARPQ
jgi:ABC-type Fe3+ transport system substrate-binding protein